MKHPRGIPVLQITDLHLFAEPGRELLGVVTDASLAAVLDQALAEVTPAALLVTGDVTQEGELDGYRRALAIVRERFSGPSVWLPGNHDLSATLSESGVPTGALTLGDWQIVTVDTHVDDQVEGHIEPAELDRLAQVLDDSDAAHVLVCGHHHPLPIGTPWLDGQVIDNAEALLALLERHESVRGYLFGHVHQTVESRQGRLDIIGSPSTCFQFEAGSAQFSIAALSPGYRWLDLGADGSISTEVERVDHIRVQPIRRDRGY
jgi:Icc protein